MVDVSQLSSPTTGGGATDSLLPSAFWRYGGVTFDGIGRYENDQSQTCTVTGPLSARGDVLAGGTEVS